MMRPVLLSAALWVCLCAASPQRLYGDEDLFRLGVLVCLTGECAEWGSNSVKGIELAVHEINAVGGVLDRKVAIEVQDTAEGGGGVGAVTAFQHLLHQGDIRYFIGPSWTTGGLSVAPLAAKRKDVIITSPSLGVAEFNEAADNMFNVWPHDEFATAALARYAVSKGWRRAAIFSSEQPWEVTQGNAFEAEFKQLKGIIATKVEPVPAVMDLRTEVMKIKSSSPDVVFLSNYNQMGIAARQLRQFGYSGPLLAILMDNSRIEAASGALHGTIFARYPEPAHSFVLNFKKFHGTAPGITADTAYDAIHLYARSIKEARTFDVDAVKARMLQSQYVGASGEILFDTQGGVKKNPVLYVVQDREMRPLG